VTDSGPQRLDLAACQRAIKVLREFPGQFVGKTLDQVRMECAL
jgi:hypothetical protein